MLFNILTLISLLIILLNLNTLTGVFPSLVACLYRWKESVNLDASVQLSRDRDLMAAILVIPFCLTIFRFNVYDPEWMHGLGGNARLGIIIGIFIVFITFRKFLEHLMRPRKINSKTFATTCKCAHTFFSILTLLLLIAGGIMAFSDTNSELAKNAMICISAITYLLFIIRKLQILHSGCSFFAAFLYLCALEIFPTGILVVSAWIF